MLLFETTAAEAELLSHHIRTKSHRDCTSSVLSQANVRTKGPTKSLSLLRQIGASIEPRERGVQSSHRRTRDHPLARGSSGAIHAERGRPTADEDLTSPDGDRSVGTLLPMAGMIERVVLLHISFHFCIFSLEICHEILNHPRGVNRYDNRNNLFSFGDEPS